jgi:hypothetical protein
MAAQEAMAAVVETEWAAAAALAGIAVMVVAGHKIARVMRVRVVAAVEAEAVSPVLAVVA